MKKFKIVQELKPGEVIMDKDGNYRIIDVSNAFCSGVPGGFAVKLTGIWAVGCNDYKLRFLGQNTPVKWLSRGTYAWA